MKKIKLIAFLFLFCSLFLIGCKDKEDDDKNNPTLPTPVVKVKDYIIIGGYTALEVTNYDSLSLFDIVIEDPNIVSLNAFMDLESKNVGKTKVTLIHKENTSVQTSFIIEVITKLPVLSITVDKIIVGGKCKVGIRNFDELIETSLDDFEITTNNGDIIEVLEDGYIQGKALGNAQIVVTSKINPLVKATINVEVADATQELVVASDYLDGIVKPGTAFSLTNLNGESLDNYKVAGGSNLILRVREDGTLVAVGEGVSSVTVYEKDNPSNSTFLTFYIEGESEVDYIAQLLDYALTQNGYVEGPGNVTKYAEWYNMQGQAWCAMFVSWCWFYAGISNDLLLKYCSCSAGMQWCLEQGIFEYKENYHPKAGDIVFFLSAGMSHTGMAIYADEEYLYTIEGNSSNKVGIWRWSLNDARITGYGVPNYPKYDGVRKDYSWVKEQKEDGSYWWTNVSEKQPVT